MDRRDDLQKILSNSVWRAKQRRVWQFFCPNCKSGRRLVVPAKPTSRMALLRLALVSGFFTLIGWPLFHSKGWVVIVPLAIGYELYYRIKLRSMMECPHCGFDPYLYTQDVKLARKEIESYWRRKFTERGLPYPGDPVPQDQKQSPPPLEG